MGDKDGGNFNSITFLHILFLLCQFNILVWEQGRMGYFTGRFYLSIGKYYVFDNALFC
jgi:hypothetical protein